MSLSSVLGLGKEHFFMWALMRVPKTRMPASYALSCNDLLSCKCAVCMVSRMARDLRPIDDISPCHRAPVVMTGHGANANPRATQCRQHGPCSSTPQYQSQIQRPLNNKRFKHKYKSIA